MVVKNHSASSVDVIVTGDGGDGIIPIFIHRTGDMLHHVENHFVLEPQGEPGDMKTGFLGLHLPQPTSGDKTTTIIFRATARGDGGPPGTGDIPIDEVVVPNALTTADGSGGNAFPFATVIPMRYQQVYASGDIGGTGIIDKIAFRPDFTNGGAFTSDGLSVEIRLSHTPKSPDGLSTTFADNRGSDETVVLNTNSLSYSSAKANCGGAGPCDFDIVIDLDDVFTFNGTSNLPLDVRLRQADLSSNGGFFDSHRFGGDSISRVANSSGNVDATVGSTDTFGLVTKFIIKNFTPSPSSASFGGSPAPLVEAEGPVPGEAGAH